MNFAKKLAKTISQNNSLLCIGLDPEFDKFPKYFSLSKFNKSIINATADLVAAYKPNIAFYEAYGLAGLKELKKTIEYLKTHYPQIPIILDAKRGDIANTARMYAKSVFEYWGVDAVTVYPNLGLDSLKPFFEYEDKLIILLVKTSNPDSKMFQDLNINGEPYYFKMARQIQKWPYQNMGIFVGATYPEELKMLRSLFPDKIFLSAGFGAQNADIKKAVESGINKKGEGIVFNASRSIIYSQNPRQKAKRLRNEINKYR